jgi:hypothetical protein
MAPDLQVPLQRGGALEKVFAGEDGVRTVSSAHRKHGALDALLAFERVVVGELI